MADDITLDFNWYVSGPHETDDPDCQYYIVDAHDRKLITVPYQEWQARQIVAWANAGEFEKIGVLLSV